MTLENKLVSLRKEKGLSQMEVAEALEVSRQAISRWEVGASMPSAENLMRLARLYGVPMDALVNEGGTLAGEQPEPAQQPRSAESTEQPPQAEAVPAGKILWRERVLGAAGVLLLIGCVLIGYAVGYRQGQTVKNVKEVIPLSQLETEHVDLEDAEVFDLHSLWGTEGG